ncbi:MAG: hypothetical protein HYZ25_08845 [Chloroflexi bacterium]|nr:hypothetical protein [Chloroflexota bacterium]
MNRTISAGPNPRIVIDSVGGDLSVVGWEGEDILIKGDEDEIRLNQSGDLVTVSSADDLSLRIPRNAQLRVDHVGGDMSLRGVFGSIELANVGGDLSVRDVGTIAIDNIQSDFSLRGARGNLAVKNVAGDASVRDVEGHVSLSVGDDLVLRNVMNGNISANVGEDVMLYLAPDAGQAVSVTAGDDILLVMAPQSNATVSMSADEIEIDWPGVENVEDQTAYVLTVGNGSASVSLNAGSDIRVTSESGAGESADEHGNFAGMMFDWSSFGDQLNERISRRVEEASRRAEEASRRAAQQAERAARRAEARVRGRAKVGRWNWNVEPGSFPPPPPPPQRDPVSEEERVAILKMLAEKKITADEADALLAALEGGS